MQLNQYLLLSLVDHQLATIEADRHGGSPDNYLRCLNTAGRWAVHPSVHSPLLVWPTLAAGAAKSAAQRASNARGRQIGVICRGASNWREGHEVHVFTEINEPALHGHAGPSETKARRLRAETDKLEAFCAVIRAVRAASDPDSFAEAARAASKTLHARFGGGSLTSAYAWLVGRAGRETLESVLAGEFELTGDLSIQQIDEVAQFVRQSEGVPKAPVREK